MMRIRFLTLKGKNIVLLFAIVVIMVTLFYHQDVIETIASKRRLPIYSVACEDMKVSFTFDLAWGAEDILSIVDTLNRNDIRACFFTVGTWAEKNPEMIKLLYDNGMEIGNHSNSHMHVGKLSFKENIEDMKKCNEKIEKITNEKVKFYRGAYGEYSDEVIKAAESLDMQTIQWDIDVLDYLRKNA